MVNDDDGELFLLDLDRPQPRELYVPDLNRPAGAVIDKNGNVACVGCRRILAVTEADIVGLGFQCVRCSTTKTDDLSSHLEPCEREKVSRPIQGNKLIAVGVALLVIAAVMWIKKWDIEWRTWSYRDLGSLFLYVFIAGIGCIGVGLANRKPSR